MVARLTADKQCITNEGLPGGWPFGFWALRQGLTAEGAEDIAKARKGFLKTAMRRKGGL